MDKVLHILPMNKVSGAERMALLICKNMKGFEPVVVCGGNELKKVFEENDIKSYSLDFAMKNIIFTVSGLRKIINDNNVKVVHAHDNTASLVAYMTKKSIKGNVKVISHIHNCYPFLKGNGINKKIDKFLRNRYDGNITCGQVVTEFYIENAEYFKKEEVLTLANAMDINYITDVDKNHIAEVVKKYDIPLDKKILGFVGRLDEQKGLIPFIKELSKHKDKFIDCRFLLVGNGSQEAEIIELLEKLELKELFILTGFQETASLFYPLMDLFFLPSLYEGLPMALLEAMAFNKAVVSMNVGSISELVNNDNGILIEKGKYNTFVDELYSLKENEMLMHEIGNEAYRSIEYNFNIKDYVNKIERRYMQL